MIAGALFYYQFNSWKNRLVTRIQRLKKPKYLFSAIVGGLYFYWYIFRVVRRGQGGAGLASTPEGHALVESLWASGLLAMVLFAWILPGDKAALAFTEAEVAFLFPAPISRRELVHFKLLKSQAAILVSAFFFSLIGRSWGGGNMFIRMIGWWVIFSTLTLHGTCASFVLTLMMERGLANWKRRLLFLAVIVLVAVPMGWWIWHTLPPMPEVESAADLSRFKFYGNQILNIGPLAYLLTPFRMVVAPFLSPTMGQFFTALVPALAIMGLHYWWVMKFDVAFEEASLAKSKELAEKVAAMRAGNWQAARKPAKAKRQPFQLRTTGYPALALLWKNLISAGNILTGRIWLTVFVIVMFCGNTFVGEARHSAGMAIGVMALMFLGMSLLLGPQLLRCDLRQDLPNTDVLKMYPLPGWQVVLGEVLTPVVLLTAAQWLLIAVAVMLGPQFGHGAIPLATRVCFGAALAVLVPFVDFLALLIPNAAVLYFPAWFHLGKDAPTGFEATGQRLIMVFGQVLILTLALLPAGLVGGALIWGGIYLNAPGVGTILGSIAAAAVLAVEAGLAVRILGGTFERFDLSAELRA